MSSAGPAHLLEKPAQKCGWGIGGGECGGVESYFPVLEEEVGG